MNQQPYDIALNLTLAVCSVLGLAYSLLFSDLWLLSASFIGLLAVIVYLAEAPKMIAGVRKYSHRICSISQHLALCAVISQAIIVVIIVLRAQW